MWTPGSLQVPVAAGGGERCRMQRRLVAGEQPLELGHHARTAAGDIDGDPAALDEVDQRGVHRLHPVVAAGLDRRVQLVGLALADEVAHGGRRQQHLDRGDAAPAVSGRQELLGDDALQRGRQHHPHVLLLVGNTSITRSTVWGASWVWSVASTRCPVSAAVSAVEIVSRSRISPTRITSGSWRSAARSASAKRGASGRSSRWLTRQRLWECRTSIGSSIVRMWSSRVRLISSMSAASVVVLPEPVGPVTSTMPRGSLAISRTECGMPSFSSEEMSEGVMRKAALTAPRCRYAFTRMRATRGIDQLKSTWWADSN